MLRVRTGFKTDEDVQGGERVSCVHRRVKMHDEMYANLKDCEVGVL